MSGEIITIIVSAFVAAVSGPVGTWVGRKLERAKYRIELKTLRAEMNNKLAEVKSKELENVRKAADILMESIVPPLKAEITNLRNDVQRLSKALERIWGCRHIDSCPVKFELLLTPKGRGAHQNGNSGARDDECQRVRGAHPTPRGDPDEGDSDPGADVYGD